MAGERDRWRERQGQLGLGLTMAAEKEQMERETGTTRPGLNIGGREETDGERERDNEARA